MRKTLLIAVGLSAAAQDARADETFKPQARQGYFLAGGFRSGVLDMVASDLGNLGFMQGGTFGVRFGEMATNDIGFGLAISSGGGQNDTWSGGYGALLLEGQYIVMDTLAFRAAIGLAGLGVGRKNDAEETMNDPGGGVGTIYVLGMSYDWFPWFDTKEGDRSGGFAFTPFFEAQAIPTDELFMVMFTIGMEATWWTGLEDNKLDMTWGQ